MTSPIRRLASVAVRVPSPPDTAGYFETVLGFSRWSEGPAHHLTADGEYGPGTPSRLLSLVPGDRLSLAELAFEVGDDEALALLADRLTGEGVATTPAPADDDRAAGIAFEDSDGFRLTCRPPSPARDPLPPSPIRPRRLGHVNLKVPDAGATVRFYEKALGLRLSEQVGELLFFLRVASDHHNLGFRSGAAEPNVHHVAFEVPGWESMRVICDHVAAHGATVEFGPGRHGPGHNLFVYLREPSSGLRIELFADMAHIDDDAFEPIRWESMDRAKTVNVWGPGPPQSFLE